MEEAMALLDQLIEEHKQIQQRIQTAEQVANDTLVILELDKAKEGFLPGRFGNQKQDLQNLLVSLETVEKGLQAHFGSEENRLLVILQKHGGERLTSGLRILFLEHGELQNRIAESKKEVAELAASGLSREVGEGKAWGIRVYISHTRKLIEVHAQSEEVLFHKLRAELKQA